MVRDRLVSACAALVMGTGGFGFGWITFPEPADLKLAKILAGIDLSIPIRTLPPGDMKAIRCMMIWIGGPGSKPELWCPAPLLPPEEREPEAVPTS